MEVGMTTSCLMIAARDGNAELAARLIEARACLDQGGKQGMTALHMAVRGRHVNLAKLMIEAGCDTNIKALGKTAGELASTNRVWALAEVLGFQEGGKPSCVTSMSEAQKKELYIQ